MQPRFLHCERMLRWGNVSLAVWDTEAARQGMPFQQRILTDDG
jgi:hypothetical protein